MKKKVATVSLAGCFGCHMSLLDIDEAIIELLKVVEFDRSPLNDLKNFTSRCHIGLIEGGCCNEANIHTLKEFRSNCDVIVAMGQCAVMGGLPVMRNAIMNSDDHPLRECLETAYLHNDHTYNPANQIPNDPAIPLILDKVYTLVDVVKVDYQIPGCPPSGDTLYQTLSALIRDCPSDLPSDTIRYD
jgi:NAD-reducing hydrogenase small subunit